MKFFHIESEAKTVTIPIRVADGKIMYFYDGPMPKLKEGAMGDLTLLESDVLDTDWVVPLREARKVRLLEAKADIMLAMRLQRIPPDLQKETIGFPRADQGDFIGAMNYRFIPAILLEPLDLILRGTKKAVLEGGACLLPSLDASATSLNHAYSLASAKYEPDRRSHTGNAFQRVYYFEEKAKRWWPLENLRSGHEAQYEEERLLSEKQIAEKRARQKEYAERDAQRKAAQMSHLDLDIQTP